MTETPARHRWSGVMRWLLAASFALAGAMKIADPHAFAVSIGRLAVVPDGAVTALAILLPWIEVAAAAALVAVPYLREAAAALLATLLLAFTAALVAAVSRGAAACGCFGEGTFLSHPLLAIGRNVILLAMAVAVFASGRRAPAHSGR